MVNYWGVGCSPKPGGVDGLGKRGPTEARERKKGSDSEPTL